MVTYDKFKTVLTQSNQKTSQKNFNFGSKKSQYCPKIPEIDLDFFRLFSKIIDRLNVSTKMNQNYGRSFLLAS